MEKLLKTVVGELLKIIWRGWGNKDNISFAVWQHCVFSTKIQHEGWGYLEEYGLVKVQARLQSVRFLLTVFAQVHCAMSEFTVHTLLCR